MTVKYEVTVTGYAAWWRLNGELHREDGPAVEWADGDKMWCLNGLLHRLDGPAVEYANGYKSWYLDGLRHRVDGPAVERADGYKSWYLNGVQLTEAEHAARVGGCAGKTVTVDGVEYRLVRYE
jgi:hypothetical protein